MPYQAPRSIVSTLLTALAGLTVVGLLTLTGNQTISGYLTVSGSSTSETALVVNATNTNALAVRDGNGTNIFHVDTSADQVLLADGATSTPTLAFSTQTDTGFFTTAQGYMALSTWGDHTMTFDGDNGELEIYEGYSTASQGAGWKELFIASDDDAVLELLSDGGGDTSDIYLTSGTISGRIGAVETGADAGYIQVRFEGGGSTDLYINSFGVGFGVQPYSTNITGTTALYVPDGNYAQLEQNFAGAPTATHCDHANELGRVAIDTTNSLLYWCMGATRGWDHLPLQDTTVGTFNLKGNAVTPTTNIFEIQNTTNNQRYMTVSSTSTALKGCTGSVSTNAVTCSGTVGVITDTTDINAGASRATITLTNTAIAAGSIVTFSQCNTPDANAMLSAAIAPGAGSGTVTVRNNGSGNQTSTWSLCFHVFNPSTP